ncbi:hypothetical protein Sjap_005225 [Stephania japonica]|uniref:Uncharacterized protein n=1 Tax=Stephania japonica TaxID=461633 RepID=A0AAP0K5Y1_9MAGN
MADEEDYGGWRGWRIKKMMQRICALCRAAIGALEVNRSRKKMMAVADSADGG